MMQQVEDIALTTNGILLGQQAAALKAAGLHRVTVSLDAIDDETFQLLSGGRGGLERVLNGIDEANGVWRHESVTEVAPRLYLDGTDRSALAPERFVDEVRHHLAEAPVAWDPYDWSEDEAEADG